MDQSQDPINRNLAETSSIPSRERTTQNPFEACSEIIDGRPFYSFAKCLEFLELKGKDLFGEKFAIYREDHQLIYRLLLYVIRDKENAAKHGLHLQKGLFLTGPIGCGKSSLIKLLSYFQPANHRFMVKSCRDISFGFIRSGYEVIHHFSHGSIYNPDQMKVYCFDDLGTESNLKYYGNECNVIGEILLSRYELFMSQGLITHTTTNLNSSEIEKYYGNRVRSRMREMFNLVAFAKDAKDKRT